MKSLSFLLTSLLFLTSHYAFADEVITKAEVFDAINIVWLGICCCLVFIMQMGFALLESGMVRAKNTINVIMKNVTDIGLGAVGYWLIGFGLMYGANSTGFIGTDSFMPNFIEGSANMNLLYQMMFAATAATIVSGAVAERFSFLPYVAGAFLLTTIIYPIFGSWVWGEGGWLANIGFYDAAGATVVHSIGAWSALGALIVIGPRHGRYSRKGALHDIPGHNVPYVAFGALLLWFGWFGFNGGSVNEDFSDLGTIFLVTAMGAIGGIVGSMLWIIVTRSQLRITLIANGTLGGLVSITAATNVISPAFALLAGILGGSIVVATTNFLNRWKIDDVVGAIPVHGFCGAWGTLVVALFYRGDMFDIERIIAQLLGILVAFIWGAGMSFLLYWILNKVGNGIRVSTKEEQRGLDITEHYEIGYSEFITVQKRNAELSKKDA